MIRRCALMFCIASLPLCLWAAGDSADLPDLLVPLDADTSVARWASDSSAMRTRSVTLNRDLLSPHMLGADDDLVHAFRIQLFDKDVWSVRILSRQRRASDRYSVVGIPENRPHAYVTMAYELGAFYAVFHEPGKPPVVVSADDDSDVAFMAELDVSDVPPCGGAIRPPPLKTDKLWPEDELERMRAIARSSGMITVDVAVVYTAQARIGAGGANQVNAQINTAIDQANLVMSNSAVNVRLRVVYQGEVQYAESGDMSLDLNRLTNLNDGFLEEVHCVRDHYGADLVQLITETGQYGGIAWIMCNPGPGFQSSGFSVSRRSALTQYVLIHEFGHNFGCDHDPDNLSGCRAHAYSQGHRFVNDIFTNKTVMAYDPGFTVGHFSNPDVSFFGSPTGIANSRDNARTLRETASIVAGFRSTAPANQGPPAPFDVQAVAVQTNAVEISWNACAATGYIVRRNGTPVGTTTNRTFIDTGLTPGVTNCWTIIATNAAGASAVSGSACVATKAWPPFVMDGAADFPSYLQSNPGMTIYAAVRGTELYVATWSPGIYPADTSKNDHFIFVADQLRASADFPAPWAKSGLVAVNMNTKPYLAAESMSDYVAWFIAPAGSLAAKSPTNAGQMEGVIDLVQAFGYMPTNIYIASAAYNTVDGGALVAQAPSGSGPNIDPHEFLVLHTLAIKDVTANGVYDRLDPEEDFVAHDIMSGETGVTITWASYPGQPYRIDYAATPLASWSLATNLTAGAGQVFMSWTDTTAPAATSRIYRVVLP